MDQGNTDSKRARIGGANTMYKPHSSSIWKGNTNRTISIRRADMDLTAKHASMMELQSIESKAEFARDFDAAAHPEVTKQELYGWYLYEFGAEQYCTAVLSTFLPLVLEDLAWRAGTLNYSDPSYPPCPDRAHLSAAEVEAIHCFVRFGVSYISPVSFSLYVGSISVGMQILAFISFGAFADYSSWRKYLLVIFATISALTCLGYLLVFKPTLYPLAALLTVVGNVCFGSSIVFFNAYLPLLADAHPRVREMKRKLASRHCLNDVRVDGPFKGDSDEISCSDPQLCLKEKVNISVNDGDEERSVQSLAQVRDDTANELSSNAYFFAYLGSVIVLLLMAAFVFATGSQSTYVLQIAIAMSGLWYLLFLYGFTFRWLLPRPGPPLPESESKYGILSYIFFSWKKTWKTILRARKLKNTFTYLISWFFFSDGLGTTAGVAILFAKSQLNMSDVQLMIVAVTVPFAALFGNFFFLHIIYRRLGLSSKSIVILLLCLNAIVPIFGLIGFAPVSIGIKHPIECYFLAALYGFFLAPLASFARVLFAELIPPGMESELFGLYEITDRGSSWLGPLLVASAADLWGSIRYGFAVVLLLYLIAFPILVMTNVKEGKKRAQEFSVDD